MRSTGLRTRLASPFLVRRLPASARPAVLLTFDDGPRPGVTEMVLERLQTHGVRAVFFLVGQRVEQAPELARTLVEAGHVPGNHSHEHGMAAWPPMGRYLADIDRCSRAIVAATGQPPRAFRAPGGRMHPASLVSPGRRGLPHLHWSVDPLDYACPDNAAAAARGVELAAEIKPRDIVLLHDDSPKIIHLLDELLPRLVDDGYDLSGGVSLLGLDGGSP